MKEINEEKEVFKNIQYSYFRDNFNLPNLPKKIDEQIKYVREFLNVSSLTVFKKKDMYVKFRSAALNQTEINMIKANIMVQIAANLSIKETNIPKYDRKKFLQSIDYALTLTKNHNDFYKLIKKSFYNCGVDLYILPNIPGSKINGASKRIGDHIMLMVNNRNNNSDSFWFTLFHEIGHIVNGDLGVSFEDEFGKKEENANEFAEEKLIPLKNYSDFKDNFDFSLKSIIEFADKINRDPGIVLGRLQKDKIIGYDDVRFNSLRKKYLITLMN